MFVLDTTTVIDFFRGRGWVAERLLATRPREVALPAIVAYEAWVGVLGSQDAARREVQFESFLAEIEVLPFGAGTARRAAQIRLALQRRGESIGPMDTLIADSALDSGAPLVTRNVREFSRVPNLDVANWYE